MKLARIALENFKGLGHHDDPVTFDLTDELGRVRDLVLFVGPNCSGKTSILDAIWFGLQGQIGYRKLRPSFRTEPHYVVTVGQPYARIDYRLTITEEERRYICQWKDDLVAAGEIGHHPGPDRTDAHLIWTYPAQPGYEEKQYGGYNYKSEYDWAVLRGKDYARRLRRISALPLKGADDIGGVFFFEQERQVIAEPVRSLPSNHRDDGEEGNGGGAADQDIRSALVDFGVKEKLGQIPQERSWYQRIRESYDYICAPHKMGEVYARQADGEYEIDFFDADGRRYQFDGLSSGERAVLNLMVQYFVKRMRYSIVLIDELELHLHPTWQWRLLQNFLRLNDGNQFIITTHSPALRQAVPSENTVELGALGDIPEWQYAAADEEEV